MERKRLNQIELARLLGVSRSAVNAWINDRAWPQGSIGALEDILGISLDAGEPRPLSEEEREELTQEYERLGRILFGGQDSGTAGGSAEGAEGGREGSRRDEGRTA